MRLLRKPILLLIAVNLLTGFFIFHHYGLAWDEPLFYNYGDALGYAYNPVNWFSGNFDLNNSYGISGDDHKTRGPAYLLLARNLVYGLEALGSDSAAAWHLVNFLFFQLGIYLLYRFALRWVDSTSAFATALLFSTQPLLWGHAFINPKDPPFLTFFLAAVCLGFEMVDAIVTSHPHKNRLTLLAAITLGIATSIRVLGPLAGALVLLYWFFCAYQNKSLRSSRAWKSLIGYGVLAIMVMLATWPYLWENPLANFINVFRFMSDNPTNLAVLFNGEVYRASDLPRRYLPFLLGVTLTEPVWLLFTLGLVNGIGRTFKSRFTHPQSAALGLTLSWFVILLTYVLLMRPAMYDGYRHFLFILPPVFIFCALAFEWMFGMLGSVSKTNALHAQLNSNKITDSYSHHQQSSTNVPFWLRAVLIGALTLPGLLGIVRLHPYEYTYYNAFIGGTDGAFRKYETDYWLTCYKEAVEQLNASVTTPVQLIVKREAYIAANYTNPNITAVDLRDPTLQAQPGDYVLVNSRSNEDRTFYKEAPIVLRVGRGDATFCIVRQIP